MIGVSKLKDDIEGEYLTEFDSNITTYNTWFIDTRGKITRKEGEGYNKYL